MKPQKERIDRYRPQGEEFDKAYTYDYKSCTDDTETSQQPVKSERIIVHEGEIPRTEETEKARYPKNIDVGRIVIEETPEEMETPKTCDILKNDDVSETGKEMETYYQDKGGRILEVKEEVVKVGRLDIIENGEKTKESEGLEERLTTSQTEKPEKYQKVIQFP